MTVLQPLDKALADSDQGKELPAKVLGMLSDALFEIREKRLEADKIAATLKSRETQLEQCIVLQLRNQEISTIGGKKVKWSLKQDDVPKVEDWTKFYDHILATQDFSLLERRVGKAAVKERWDDQQQVPGVSKFPVYKLSREKVKG